MTPPHPYFYHPDLLAPIIIFNDKTFRAAKIFWDDVESLWKFRMEHHKIVTTRLPGIYRIELRAQQKGEP